MANKSCKVMLVMTPKDKDMLRRLAELDDISMSQVIRLLIRKKAKVRLTKKRRVVKRFVRRVK